MDKSLKNIASTQIFAPYFRARYQNMQNIINDSQIISFVPKQFTTYYTTYIRQWLQWSTGFVPMLHRNEFFSTGIGATIVKVMVRELMNGGYRFEGQDRLSRQEVQEWAKKNNFDNLLSEAFWNSNAVGNAFLKLTPVNGELVPSVFSSARMYVEIDRTGNVSKAICLNRFITNTVDSNSYWAKEERVMDNGVAYYRVLVGKQGGMVTSPSWEFNPNFSVIPENLVDEWNTTYGEIEPNTWYELPMKTLGIYNIKNDSVAIALSDMPGYADSTLHTALDILYSIDFNYTSGQMDMYWGRTRVLTPKPMQPRVINKNVVEVSNGLSYVEAVNSAPLDDDVFTKLETSNEEQSPVFIQPQQRGEEHKKIRDADLEFLSMKIGLSAGTLSSHLASGGRKTATQVITEDDMTTRTIGNKRALANIAINKMLKDLADFYGLAEVPDITWNRDGGFSTEERKFLMDQYKAGVLPLREYIKKINTDLTAEEVDQWVIQLNEEKKSNDVQSLLIKNGKEQGNGTI